MTRVCKAEYLPQRLVRSNGDVSFLNVRLRQARTWQKYFLIRKIAHEKRSRNNTWRNPRNVAHLWNIQAPSGHICRDEQSRPSLPEKRHCIGLIPRQNKKRHAFAERDGINHMWVWSKYSEKMQSNMRCKAPLSPYPACGQNTSVLLRTTIEKIIGFKYLNRWIMKKCGWYYSQLTR